MELVKIIAMLLVLLLLLVFGGGYICHLISVYILKNPQPKDPK